MPVYVYEFVFEDDDEPGRRFEYRQKITDPPLTRHPITGDPVRRVITAPTIATSYSETKSRGATSDKTLERLGFTKYVKTGDGQYEKTCGVGPREMGRVGPPETDPDPSPPASSEPRIELAE